MIIAQGTFERLAGFEFCDAHGRDRDTCRGVAGVHAATGGADAGRECAKARDGDFISVMQRLHDNLLKCGDPMLGSVARDVHRFGKTGSEFCFVHISVRIRLLVFHG